MSKVPLYVSWSPKTLKSTLKKAMVVYRGTSLTTNAPPLGPYSRTTPRAPWWT